MNQISAHKVGLVVGGALAVWHIVWALMVSLGVAKLFLDWILNLHFLNFQYSIDQFDFFRALILVIVTGIIGYILGYICGRIWNLTHRTPQGQ